MDREHSVAEVLRAVAAFTRDDVLGNYLASVLAAATVYMVRRLCIRRRDRLRGQEEAAAEE
ncbi:hypothetical protein [Streptomyces vietnamensis]|uniref:hypothetical protein n=1 Tax=Streptomyces vietnamensis TaxID=362257 RepID=UPI00341B4497